jgi:hypothetical protein
MKLSDAMRLGAMNGPQVFGQSFDGDGSCALGAAILAQGCQIIPNEGAPVNAARDHDTGGRALVPTAWVHVLQSEHQCPDCDTAVKG